MSLPYSQYCPPPFLELLPPGTPLVYDRGMKEIRIHIKLDKRELEVLDTKRGSLSRSAYIRLLIEKAGPIYVRL